MPDWPTLTGDLEHSADSLVSPLSLTAIVVDQDGVVIAADRETPGGESAISASVSPASGDWVQAVQGVNYIEACHALEGADAALGQSMAAGVRDILADRAGSFELNYSRQLADGTHQFIMRVVRIPGRGRLQAVITHTDISARQSTQVSLRVSQTQLQGILDTIKSGVISFNDDQEIVYFNRFAEEIFGYQRAEVLGKPVVMLLPGLSRALAAASTEDGAEREGTAGQAEGLVPITGFRKSGEEFPIEIAVTRMAPDHGILYAATIRDTTRHSQIEASEREQRALAEALSSTAMTVNSTLDIRQVLDHILACVGLVVPHDGANVMLIEDQVARVVCVAGEYVRQGRLNTFVGTDLPLNRFTFLREVMESGQSAIITDTQADPRWLRLAGTEWVRSSINVPVSLGGQVFGFLNLDSKLPDSFGARDARHLDVFAAQAAIAIRNAQLFENEHFQRLLAESLHQTTEAMTKSTATQDILPLMLTQLTDLIEGSWAAVFLIEDNELELISSVGAQEDEPPDGAEKPHLTFLYQAIPLLYDPLSSGQPMIERDIQLRPEARLLDELGIELHGWIGVAIVAWDIVIGYLAAANDTPTTYSKRQVEAVQSFAYQAALILQNSEVFSELEISRSDLNEAQSRLARAAQLQVAGEIATGIAHQVNNPLTTVIAESYLLAKYLPPDSKHYESVAAIRDAAYRAGTVIQRLVDFARAKPFSLEPVDVNQSVGNAAALLRDQIEPQIAVLTLDLAAELPPIQGSERHLEDVWLNLLLNARDAIDPPGSGEIRLSTAYDKRGDQVVITITDNGQGIAPDRLDKIFKPFYTTKDKGTGLGLSICRDVVAKHGGTIRIESAQHGGATAVVTLPVGARRR